MTKLPKLDDFIAQSSASILDGVAKAQAKYDNIGVGVVGPYFGDLTTAQIAKSQQTVEFEIAVAVSQDTSVEGGGKFDLTVASANIGGDKSDHAESAATIKFGINFVPPMVKLDVNPSHPQAKPSSQK